MSTTLDEEERIVVAHARPGSPRILGVARLLPGGIASGERNQLGELLDGRQAAGRRATTPRVRARTSGEARQVATAS
jgi:hypothetical protein